MELHVWYFRPPDYSQAAEEESMGFKCSCKERALGPHLASDGRAREEVQVRQVEEHGLHLRHPA